ncbi:uncharacterized protein LOC114481584 [Gouania willdenowi]|uniref:uncharacterized protein LOC114481584 n=1 Tax=Gouania willdenowi TaxID=441366 RepID=UPI00105648E1|nr:uncharacterized protein LOC114481584 [Gouania willdenowi]
MDCFWKCLILCFIQQTTTVSSDYAVSLICKDTVEVPHGQSVTINCTTVWHHDKCSCYSYLLRMNKNNTQYKWNEENFVVDIPVVTKQEIVEVSVHCQCGDYNKSITLQPYVMLPICDDPVKVQCGQSVTITPKDGNQSDCQKHWLSRMNQNTTKYECKGENYVLENIPEVTKTEIVMVSVICHEERIKTSITLPPCFNLTESELMTSEGSPVKSTVTTIVLSVLFTVVGVAAVAYVVYKSRTRRMYTNPGA